MKVRETEMEGLLILEPEVYRDPRGYFMETYHLSQLESQGIHRDFIQDNQSRSSYGVIRGLHFQRKPHGQAKLIRVTEGAILDVAVDIREGSSTYGKWFGLELNAENQLQLLIPDGFAHGFSVLSDNATVFYKCDAYYHPASESGIRYDDPDLRIDWRIDPSAAVISGKDRGLPLLKDL